jgi:O-antigen biosynthesis protein
MRIRKRVLLVTSAAPSQTPFSTWEKKPPLGVGFLLSMLRQAGHDVFFIDNYLEPSDFLETGYLQTNGIDYVGIYISTICFRDTQRMLHKIEYLRRSGHWCGKIIVGGPHTTVALDTIPPFVDHVVQGEGEQAIVDIVEGTVKDRVVRYPRIRDLDALPMPAWDLFTKLPYSWETLWFPETPTFTMTTSRGCPFRCAFCSVGAVWGKQYTCFSAARIVSDIEHLIEHYGAKGVYFREDNFTLDRKRVVEFCKLLMDRHIDIRWACESRVDSLDNELLELMHKAGARGFYFGIESGSQRILDELHKGISVDQIRTCFRLCNEIGFNTAASVIVGLPQETDEDIAATDSLLSEIKPTVTWHNVFVGIPSSKLYRHVIDRKLYEFIDDRGLVYLKGHNDKALKYYRNAWDAAVPFHPESPAISVIMAAHNAADFLQEAIDSILKQTYPNFEFLVVDDASTDETGEILSRCDDPRIRIFTNHEKLGPAGSRNRALRAARGPYIAIMDADDISLPHRLEIQIRFLESHPYYALVGSSYYVIDRKNEVQRIVDVLTNSDAIQEGLLQQNWFGHSTVMMRKDAVQALSGYDEEYYYSHDYDLFLRMSEQFRLSNIGEPLCYWRSTPEAISARKKEEQRHYAERAVLAAIKRRKEIGAAPDKPLVSVIVPTYNRPDMLGETLQSILRQTYPNIEILVVNDAGASVEGVIASLDPGVRIRYLQHDRNRGLAAARNTGIRAARGMYIAYLDDDDVYYPDHIETLVRFLETSEYSVAYTDAYRAHQLIRSTNHYEITQRDLPYSFDFDSNKFLFENYIPVLCLMHRKKCLDTVGLFDEALKRTEDWDLWIRMSRQYSFAHIPTVTAEFRWRSDGSSMVTSAREPFAWAALHMFHKYRDYAAGNENALSHHRWIVQGSLSLLQQSMIDALRKGECDIYKRFCADSLPEIIKDLEALAPEYPEHRDSIQVLMSLLNRAMTAKGPGAPPCNGWDPAPEPRTVVKAHPFQFATLYVDTGKGFNEVESLKRLLPSRFDKEAVTLEFDVRHFKTICALRFDPIENAPAGIDVVSVILKGRTGAGVAIPIGSSNAIYACGSRFVFSTRDPALYLSMPEGTDDVETIQLVLKYSVGQDYVSMLERDLDALSNRPPLTPLHAKLYIDDGTGFSESSSLTVPLPLESDSGVATLTFPLSGIDPINALRLDPIENAVAIVEVNRIELHAGNLTKPLRITKSNAEHVKDNRHAFMTDDPSLHLEVPTGMECADALVLELKYFVRDAYVKAIGEIVAEDAAANFMKDASGQRYISKLYVDHGSGFIEGDALVLELPCDPKTGRIGLDIDLKPYGKIKALRWDPIEHATPVVELNQLHVYRKGEPIRTSVTGTNAKSVCDNILIFASDDPYLEITLPADMPSADRLHVEYRVLVRNN